MMTIANLHLQLRLESSGDPKCPRCLLPKHSDLTRLVSSHPKRIVDRPIRNGPNGGERIRELLQLDRISGGRNHPGSGGNNSNHGPRETRTDAQSAVDLGMNQKLLDPGSIRTITIVTLTLGSETLAIGST